MPGAKRRKVLPRRIGHVPDWARQLLAGQQPDRSDPEAEAGLFGWAFLDDQVPGLPPCDLPEGVRLIHRAGGWPPPPRG